MKGVDCTPDYNDCDYFPEPTEQTKIHQPKSTTFTMPEEDFEELTNKDNSEGENNETTGFFTKCE